MTDLKVIKLQKTCIDCPVQFEGTLEDGRMLYARYRNGRMSISISKEKTDNIEDAIAWSPWEVDSFNAEFIFDEKIDKDFDGYMEDDIFLEYLRKSGLIVDSKLLKESNKQFKPKEGEMMIKIPECSVSTKEAFKNLKSFMKK